MIEKKRLEEDIEIPIHKRLLLKNDSFQRKNIQAEAA
jgi:hypothetical protein